MATVDIGGARAQTTPHGLEEIFVAAQKRAQSVQDAPVAVTALTEATLEVNFAVNFDAMVGGTFVEELSFGIDFVVNCQ